MSNKKYWIFTFGCGQEFVGKAVKISGDFSGARRKMIDKYGLEWAFQYSEKEWNKIKNITETAKQKGFEVVWMVAETPEALEAYQARYPFMEEAYFGDELEIKTIVRFNPGLIWLDEGLVKDKWSAIDFDKAWARI